MVKIKNYYDQKHELYIAKIRLQTLLEKRDLYFTITQPRAVNYDSERVTSSPTNNCFDTYLSKIEDIDKQILDVKAEIFILEKNIKIMEISLRKFKNPLEKIFVAKYIDNLTINQMCRKFNYSRPQIYRKLDKIKQIINGTKNETK